MNDMKITAIANCGLLIESMETKLLIDGIYDLENIKKMDIKAAQPDDLFSAVSDEVMERIINGTGEMRGVEFLLFTHCHADHFDADKTMECMKHNSIESILLPSDRSLGALSLKEYAEDAGTGLIEMDLPFGVMEEYILKDVHVRAFKTRHYGNEFSFEPHYCFLISSGCETVYISGDADFIDGYQQTMLSGETIDIGFFNPLHVAYREGRNLISHIHIKKIVIYHVPFEKDDRHGFRQISCRNLIRYSESLPAYEIISEELQKINF